MCAAFSDADHRLGGGYARSTLLHYVNQVVLPLLRGSYDDTIGRELIAANRAVVQSVRVHEFRFAPARARPALLHPGPSAGAGQRKPRAGGAHPGRYGDAGALPRRRAQALDLASAGLRTGLGCGSPSTAARCAALQGREHAVRGDRRACAQACTVAERALDRAVPADEPAWIQFFTAEQLSAEMLYMASDLGRRGDVQQLAPGVLTCPGGMQRRRVLCATALAMSYLPAPGNNSGGDVDRAATLLLEVIPSLGSLSSARSLERFNSARRALAAHAERPSVQELSKTTSEPPSR